MRPQRISRGEHHLKFLGKLSPTSWLTTKTVFSQLFALVLFAVQAPVLGPRAFGLISIVMAFVGFCEYVAVEAAAESLISIREIDHEHFDTMTTVNLGLALLLGAGVYFAAPQIAVWFGDPELVRISRWMALLPAVSALTAAPTAATKRDMLFQPLALRSIGGVLVGGVVGLILTLTGAGVWALVWQAIVSRLMVLAVLWYMVPLKFRLGFSARHFQDLLVFAAPTLVSRLLTWSCNQLPRVMLGLYWGSVELGLFSLAARLGDLVMEVAVVPRYAVARVELRRYALDAEGLRAAVKQSLTLLTVLSFPLFFGAAAVVPTLFRVWLDPRWNGAILPTQCLLLTCVGLVTQYLSGATLLAMNFQKSEAVVSIAQTIATVAVVVICAPFGLVAAAVGIAARPFLLLPLCAHLVKRHCGLSAEDVFKPQAPALAASAVMGVSILLLRRALQGAVPDVVALPLLVAAGGLVYVALIRMLMPAVVAQLLGRFVTQSSDRPR